MTMTTMTMRMTTILLATSLAGCAGQAASPDERADSPVTVDQGVKDVPAVDRARYPDSIGYLYRGDVATVLWMQNTMPVASREELETRLRRGMERGLTGEVIRSVMQHVDAVANPQPTLSELAQRAVQSVRLLAQYSFTARDYGQALGTALSQYNAAVDRRQAIADAAVRVEAALTSIGTSSPGGPLPAAPLFAHQRVVQPGRYFADAVQDSRRTYLHARARALQQAIAARDTTAYGNAFPDVFYAQLDPALRDRARDALAVSHEDAILKGQPLDTVIAQYVRQAPDQALTMEELRLINQINLRSNQVAVPKQPLVAALLLLDEDHRLGEKDPDLSCVAIWSHIQDLDWLVSHYVRLKADGTTKKDVLAAINSILQSIAAR
jgi:hypothetical protein